ncbi:hypothetical protein CPB84DRAFT_1746031 [Gymnopilus junonius]|uniref:Uncharacterized protein n=1 Tax=Gymnopilus junonius TaxID=109634 RepID=A0A9P5NU53_GYMJU|nr:hypothetical protein CPB84DRAFT_1746031 [Gymnopilus junonius]
MYQNSMQPMPRAQYYDPVPFRYCGPELVQRISSWRMGIQHTADSTDATGPAPNATRTRSRQQKPYARPEQRSSARNSFASDIYVSDAVQPSTSRLPIEIPVQPSGGDGLYSGQVHYIAKPQRSYELPDPERNPLVTTCQADLEEEYSHVARLYENLQQRKNQLERAHVHHAPGATVQQLMDVGVSIQRLISCAHYIVAYSQSLGFNINFAAILQREQQQQLIPTYAPAELSIKMPQPRTFSEGWKVNPL